MINYIIKRIGIAIPTLLILIAVSFYLMHAAPGGPFTSERPLPPQVLANIEAKYGLDHDDDGTFNHRSYEILEYAKCTVWQAIHGRG